MPKEIKLERSYKLSPSSIAYEDDKRGNFMFGFIGQNRTGKTTLAQRIARWWKNSRPACDIVAFDPQDKFSDIANIFIDAESKTWPRDCCYLKDTLLILDDYRYLHEQDKPMKGLKTFMTMKNKNNVDVIYITHNPQLVLNIFSYHTTNYFIYASNSTEGSFKDKIPNYYLCSLASKIINDYVAKNGLGEYPNFPCVEVNSMQQKLIAYNMNKF